jgi:hypothetical protein
MTLAHVEPEPDRETLNLGRLLRSARMARDLSQAELAAVIGVSERSVRSWEHGSPPPADVCWRWRMRCGCGSSRTRSVGGAWRRGRRRPRPRW